MNTIISTIIFILSVLSISAQEFNCIKSIYKLDGAIYRENNLTEESNILISNEKLIITTSIQSNSWESNNNSEKTTNTKEWKLHELNEISNSKNGKLDFGEEIIVTDSENEKWKGYLYDKGDKNYFILSNFYISSEIWYELTTSNLHSQKELISKWERTYSDHYSLEIYYEKNAEYPLTSIMLQNNQAQEFILNIDDNGLFLFYNKFTFDREMFAELRVIKGEHRLYFNSGSLYLKRTYAKSDSEKNK